MASLIRRLKRHGLMPRSLQIRALPYEVRVYVNNQVIIPASLVKALGLEKARRARITIEYKGFRISFNTLLLRTRHTASRQFTIPKNVRMEYGIKPFDVVRVVSIEETGENTQS